MWLCLSIIHLIILVGWKSQCYALKSGKRGALVMKPGGPYETSGGPRENVLNVHLVPHTHDDVGWLKTVDELYLGARSDIQMSSVQYILESVIDGLLENADRKFVYVEMAFFSRWWRRLSVSRKAEVSKLLKSGRLEFLNGGWASNDEATPSFVDIVDQHTMGSEFISREFGSEFTPTVGWQVDPFGHSKFQAKAYSMMGMNSWFFGRSDSQDFAIRKKTHRLEVVIDSAILTGSMDGYGAPTGFDWDILSKDSPLNDDEYLGSPNVEERLDAFVQECERRAEMYNRKSSSEKTQHVMLTMGSDFEYANAKTWFSNMDKLIHYANQDGRINVFYSNPRIYTEQRAHLKKNLIFESPINYDWFPYCDSDKTEADETGKLVKVEGHAYWTGYFSSRPYLKRKVREASAMLEHCRLAELRRPPSNDGQNIEEKDNPVWMLWDALSVAQHHDGVSGTAKRRVAWDYYMRLDKAMETCRNFIRDLVLVGEKDGNPREEVFLHSSLSNDVGATSSEAVNVQFGYYTSSTGFTEERPDQASGAYIFRPDCEEGPVSPCRPTLLEDADWLKYTVLADRVEWEIGPIPEDEGKEIVLLISPKNIKIENKGVFFTDSNAFEWMRREINKRPTWDYVVTDPVSGNYYPVVSSIAIVGSGKALIVTSDRSVGGSSLESNQIEIMIHRKTNKDDARGMDEPLIDLDDQGREIIVKGTTFFRILDAPEENEVPISVPLDQIRPPVSLGPLPAHALKNLPKPIDLGRSNLFKLTHFHRVNIPEMCRLGESNDCILIRLAYLGNKGVPVTINLPEAIEKANFGMVIKITETVLHGGISVEEASRRKINWNDDSIRAKIRSHVFSKTDPSNHLIIKPGEIRTFIAQVKVDGGSGSTVNVQTVRLMLSIDGTLFAGAGLALVRFISWNRAQKFGPKITVIGDVECHIIADRLGEIPDWGDKVYVPNPPSVKAGGSCLNTAIWLRNLSHSFYVTVPQTYSRDGVWTEVINQSAQKAFLNVVPSSRNESMDTGTSLCLAGSNERCFIKYAGANAIFKLSDFETDVLVPEKTRHLHFGGYFNCPGIWGDEIISFIKTCRQKSVKTISLNPQYTQDWDKQIYSILPHIDFFICNKHEAITITDLSDVTDSIQELSKLCNCIVVTLGEEGALLMRKCVDLRPLRILCKESTEMSFEDTIGVGDAFCAGFISEIVSKNLGAESPQLIDAVRFACACGTAACTVTGGSTYPGTQTIRECLID